MKVFDIYRLELKNTDCCYLIKDGIFWRAYEKSAMQFCEKINAYQVTKKHFKGINSTMFYMGFPNSNLNPILEKCRMMNLLLEKSDNLIKISGFEIQTGFEEWKSKFDEIPLYIAENQPDYGVTNQNTKPLALTSIEEKIRLFPIASKTPMDCQQFLYELQNQINGALR